MKEVGCRVRGILHLWENEAAAIYLFIYLFILRDTDVDAFLFRVDQWMWRRVWFCPDFTTVI